MIGHITGEGGLAPGRGLHPRREGVCLQGGLHLVGVCIQGVGHDTWDIVNKREVRILLECILV